ncbi:MAG: alkaline phosphatase family protein, partial [Bacteroidota bacterium]|nr:alkaline phosphatase family protein [Bacteroidota bacterium]
MIRRSFFSVIIFTFIVSWCSAFAASPEHNRQKPKLVVAIIVDQMRADYIDRFYDLFDDGGFRLLSEKGARFTQCNYDHAPTYTAPGHSIFLSGVYPGVSGIIGNEWYSIAQSRSIYCCEDSTVNSVGDNSSVREGQMSPHNYNASTLGDWLKSVSASSKVVGVAIKDRGAILPAGQHPTGAFWFDSQSGNWISSSYYFTTLPDWAQAFNNRHIPESYLNQTWQKLLPESLYARQSADNAVGEGTIPGEKNSVFPHKISNFSDSAFAGNPQFSRYRRFDALLPTPMGNDLTVR